MNRSLRVVLLAVFTMGTIASAFAIPPYLENYKKDPFRKADMDGCVVCHNSPAGGARNPFGQAIEGTGGTFSTLVRAQYPDRFAYPVFKLGETMTIHFADPNGKQVVVEANAKKYLVDADKKSVNGIIAEIPEGK